jgi:hypothetical protein
MSGQGLQIVGCRSIANDVIGSLKRTTTDASAEHGDGVAILERGRDKRPTEKARAAEDQYAHQLSGLLRCIARYVVLPDVFEPDRGRGDHKGRHQLDALSIIQYLHVHSVLGEPIVPAVEGTRLADNEFRDPELADQS